MDLWWLVVFTGNINPDCATLEFPVSPAQILSPGGCLLVATNESKQKVRLHFYLQFYSWEDLFLNTSCYNSVISVLISIKTCLSFYYYCILCPLKKIQNMVWPYNRNHTVCSMKYWVPRLSEILWKLNFANRIVHMIIFNGYNSR